MHARPERPRGSLGRSPRSEPAGAGCGPAGLRPAVGSLYGSLDSASHARRGRSVRHALIRADVPTKVPREKPVPTNLKG